MSLSTAKQVIWHDVPIFLDDAITRKGDWVTYCCAKLVGLPERHNVDTSWATDEVSRAVEYYLANSPHAKFYPFTDPERIPMNIFPFFRGVLVKGQHFLDDAGKKAANAVMPGDELILHAEPQNAHDCYAVAVHTQAGVRVGYLQKEVSAACAWFLAIKMPMKVQVIASGGKAGNLQVNILENKP